MPHPLPASDIMVVVYSDAHLHIKLDDMTFTSGRSLYSNMLQVLDDRPDRPAPVGANIYYLSSNKMNISDKHSITDHYIVKDKQLHVQLVASSEEEATKIVEGDQTLLVIIVKMTGTMTFPDYDSEDIPNSSTPIENNEVTKVDSNNNNNAINCENNEGIVVLTL